STVYATRKNHGEAFSYDAFGRSYEGNLEFARNIGYNGKRMDPIIKIVNYGYRHYKPLMKRWTTIDPIRDGLNWYVYCSNDPINFIDLFGLLESDIQAAHGVKIDPYNPSGDAYQPTLPIPGPTEEELRNQERLGYVCVLTGSGGLISGILSGVKDIATGGEVKIWTALKIVGAVKVGGIGLELIVASHHGTLLDINLGILTP
ncbi:MAG: RHS repeat-associated core domain-containing protein, partial [Spirochaetales bacterium]|nr:RHS repeat-associated core domain-containing protein [Spirochaetales bacterium]